MPRGKRIVIERSAKDSILNKFKSLRVPDMKSKRASKESEIRDSIRQTVKKAEQLYEQDKFDKESIRSLGLLTIEEAYNEVVRNGVDISSRAFGGRVERRSIRSEKIGKKRLIPKHVIYDWISLHKEFYSVKEAFEILKTNEKDLNLRAFIGRVEKNSVPSIKIGTQRWVPKDAIECLTHVAKNYYDVSEAIGFLQQKGIKIRRNAFERRLDRNRIPHEKIGGRRVIAKDVMDELAAKESALAARKSL